jgi:hypothetical protein
MRRLLLLALVACNPTAAPGMSGPTPSSPTPMRAAPGMSGPTPSSPTPMRAAPAGPAAPATPATPAALDLVLEPLRPLLGAWDGSDPNLHATGRFTLEPDLGGKILVRRNRNDSPQGHHDDLLIVFAAPGGLRASYFDNEGHVIQYAVTVTADRVELVSDEAPGQPRFRLRYVQHGADELAVDFAIAMPGAAEFKHYTGGVVHRAR